jgi:hypothetical protein
VPHEGTPPSCVEPVADVEVLAEVPELALVALLLVDETLPGGIEFELFPQPATSIKANHLPARIVAMSLAPS